MVSCETPLVKLTELIDLTALIIGSIPLTPPSRSRLTRRNGTRLVVVLGVVFVMFSENLCLVYCCVSFLVPVAILRGWPLLTTCMLVLTVITTLLTLCAPAVVSRCMELVLCLVRLLVVVTWLSI